MQQLEQVSSLQSEKFYATQKVNLHKRNFSDGRGRNAFDQKMYSNSLFPQITLTAKDHYIAHKYPNMNLIEYVKYHAIQKVHLANQEIG